MPRTLSDEDIEAVASRVVELLRERLSSPPPEAAAPQSAHAVHGPAAQAGLKLVYTVKELASELNLSTDTIYKFISIGRLRPMAGLRTKRFSRAEVERLLKEVEPSWRD
jgi:excisionase family DNA binding protein